MRIFCFVKVCVTTIGVCVFGALTSVDALFYLEGNMKNNTLNEQTENFVENIVKQVQGEMEENFNLAQTQMEMAEEKLVESLSAKQLTLYQDFCKKREGFYKKAKNLYEKRF